MCDKHNNEPTETKENNNFAIKATNDNQKPTQAKQQQELYNSGKTSIYDWDSPSSSTGTIKRTPRTIDDFKCSQTNSETAIKWLNETSEIITNNNVATECQNKSKQSSPQQTTGHIRRSSIQNATVDKQLSSTSASSISINNCKSLLVTHPPNMQKSPRTTSSSSTNKDKPQKLRLNTKTADRNANSTSNSPTTHNNSLHSSTRDAASTTSHCGTIRKTTHKRSKYNSNEAHQTNRQGAYQDENYMEFEFFEREIPNRQMPQFTELFRDFPVSYETTTLALQSTTLPNKPPPLREPLPPTPPPLSQLPSRNLRNNENTQSCPSTPFRGKVVLSKKERKELSKLNKLQDANCSNSASNIRVLDSSDSAATSAQSSPYKGRVTELKNCIARINSKGLFASLHRNSQKSLNNQTQNPEEQATSSSNEISPPPPAPDTSPPSSNASNNNDADYTEKLKNLPVRQRKAHTSHMDNYCLFDPMDFVNEKALRRRTHASIDMNLPLPQQQQGLRDPLFSSRQNLDFSEEELVPEVIYDDEKPSHDEELTLEIELPHQRNFDHHNYFVIDPDDFEEEPQMDIGIPNPFSNEQLVQANLTAHTQHIYSNNPEEFKASESLEKLLNAFESTPGSMTNSQESKDTTTTTTSTALVESSSSTNSNTSSTSNTSSQTTLQRTKKRLTFLNLSPFRSNKTDKEKSSSHTSQPKQERAVSELVTSEHMIHLHRMLLSADNVLSDTRPINENIELNYVLFNPGPVPSRNIQYKIRKARPLSTHSDADSGFLSPCSPDEFSAMKFNPALLVLQQCDSVQGYIEIYTDWANYYLERSKSKKKVTDLSADCRDGLLLAEVIEAVTSFKVPDLHKKPKNQQQMYDNVNSCLNILRSQTVSGLDNITTNDICCGRLKAVLALFFALSRYKQHSKQIKCNNATPALSIKAEIHQQPNTTNTSNTTVGATNAGGCGIIGDKTNSTTNSTSTIQNANVVVGNNAQQHQHVQSIQNGNDTMVNRQIPQAYTKANGTAIPLPATVMVQRRCPPDKVRPLPPTPNHTPSIPGLGKSGSDFNGSRPNSPPSSNHSVQSLKSGNNNGLRPPSIIKSGIPAPGTTITPTVNGQQKHSSMLDKLKLFNKDKSATQQQQQQQQQQQTTLNQTNKNQIQSKRTSSSSGFSSARSERSDSSLSLNDGHISQIKPPTVSLTSANKNRQEAKGKQTNLLKQHTKKDQMKNASKLDKKEKSPARSLHKEDTGLESRSSTLNRSKNSLTRAGMGNDKSKTSSRTSLNNKSESKTSLIMPPVKALNSPNGTALPKPIAAIKGTSKLQTATENKNRLTSSNSTQDIVMKREKSDISNAQQTQQQTNISHHAATANNAQQQQQQQPPTHIVKPVPIMAADTPHKTAYYANTTQQSYQQHQQLLNQMGSMQQDNIYSRLPPPKAALGTPSSVRKLEYNSGPGVLQPQQHSPLRNLTTTPLTTHSQPVTPTIQPANALGSAANNKFHTIPSKIAATIYEEDKPVNVQPMRPLLRGYNSHVTLPTRGSRGTHNYVADFCENDINQGYCSDGDSMRFSTSRMGHSNQSPQLSAPRFHDIDNGYLSEGSSGCYASHGKHFLSMMRARTQLPTTIEERIRNSRGSLDSIGTAVASSAASQASSSGGSNPKMDMSNGLNVSGNNSANNSPQHHHSSPNHHRSSTSRSGRDNWSKMPEPLNGQKMEHKEKSSPSRRSLSGTNSKQGSPSASRTKGVPPSFGYVKRSNGCNTATAEQQNIAMMMNNSSSGGGGGGGSSPQNGRTAHVSAVPRSSPGSRKVQGGTQTLPHEVTKMPLNPQHRSFSLTGPGATQLSQCIRERLAGSHSLPKQGSDMHMFQHRLSNRPGKMLDGSLSDTQTYAEVKPEYSSYAMWLKHSNTAGSRLSEGDAMENIQIGSPSLSRHNHKMMQHRAAVAAANAAAAANNNIMAGAESPYVQSPRLNRSNSIRGPDVELEPYYCLPVGAQHNGVLSAQMAAAAANAQANNHNQQNNSIAWSQPTSPTPITRGFNGPMSPTHGNNMAAMQGVPQGSTATHRLTYPKKNDEVHGSTASLLSGGSSLYGTSEERQAQEIRRLKRELMEAREQVLSLSGQLSTNAHVVAAFEQSLSNMTSRLQHLTATAERKDGELTDMRQTIELLRKQSIQAGLTTAHMQSMGVQTQSQTQNDLLSNKPPPPLPPSMPGQHVSRVTQHHHQQSGANGQAAAIQRHPSSDSMCSVNSIGSSCSTQDKKQKKKGWLRSSFTKAFSRNAKIAKTSRHVGHNHSGSQASDMGGSHASSLNRINGHADPPGLSALATQPPPPLPGSPTKSSPAKTVTLIDNAKPIDAIDHDENIHVVEELKKQLREKDLVLTDIRLEALSSASQLESLKETVNKMRAEMMSLKQNNERLQKLVTSRSLAGSEASLGNAISPNGSIGESRRYSLADGNSRPPMELPKRLEEEVEEENIPPAPAPEPPPPPISPTTHIDLTPPPPALEAITSPAHIVPTTTAEDIQDVSDGKKLAIACYLGQPESFAKYCEEMLEVDDFYANSSMIVSSLDENGERKAFPTASPNEFLIAYTYISGKTSWQNLDYIVRKTFKDYVSRIDPGTNLGLNTDSITSYHLGEAKRGPEMGFPELLPCGYIVGNVRTLYICLQGVGSLAFDSLIPRSIVHRYISLLTEHRRLILCGPSGTGKSYLARRLAEFLVARSGRGNPSEAIATFNVDHKSSKELRQYLGHIAEQASIANGASELPSVIILDNLHHASALGDVFSCLLSAGPAAKLPCIIGTMSQATCNTTNLQLHHNFRWVLTANHMEPVKGFLGRFLRRRLFQLELQTQHSQPDLASVLAWLPTVWQHINRFLEAHSSSDVTIGPRLFLACPLDLKESQVWFTDIWNYHLSPYVIEAVREGVQLYGRRGGAWNDPSAFIRNSYPWPYGPDSVPPLRQINAEDVGLEGVAANNGDNQDPLLNMLMRLQEAANYSENQDQESDCASLDSNITPDSSAGAE